MMLTEIQVCILLPWDKYHCISRCKIPQFSPVSWNN